MIPRAALGLAALMFAGGTARAQSPPPTRPIVFSGHETTRCLACHGMPNLGYRDSTASRFLSFTVPADSFSRSAHHALNCQQCHADVTSFPHTFPTRRTPVSCAQDCHAADSTGRPYTHAQAGADFRAGAHGRHRDRSDPDSLTCGSCHGGDAHAVARLGKTLTPAQKMAFCVTCHDDRALMARDDVTTEAVASYRRSFHYKAILFGQGKTAACPDCHTGHRVLAATDTASTVAPGRLPQTCGQTNCHAGARRNFAISGANHLDLRVAREPLLLLEERLFILLTAGTMLMLAVGIVLDVQRKFGWIAVTGATAARLRRSAGAAARAWSRVLRVARVLLVE